MKRRIQLAELQPLTRDFIIRLRAKRKEPYSSSICCCEVLDILLKSNAAHKESILHGTYNHTLELQELQIGYDGDDLMDIAIYYLETYIKERIKKISAM